MLTANTGGVPVDDVRTHDHGLDEIMVAYAHLTASSPRYPVTLRHLTCDRYGRQGLS